MKKSFRMQKVSLVAPIAIFGSTILLLVGLAGAFSYVLMGSRTVVVTDTAVKADGTVYSTTISRSSIDTANVKIVDLEKTPEFQPDGKKDGFGLPGLKEGWYELKNGKKAFLMLTDWSKVVVVPTSDYWLLISADHPGAELLITNLKMTPKAM